MVVWCDININYNIPSLLISSGKITGGREGGGGGGGQGGTENLHTAFCATKLLLAYLIL